MTTGQLFSAHKLNTAKLPDSCFGQTAFGAVYLLRKGVRGISMVKTDYTAAQLNKGLGVTPQQVAAMEGGRREGFHSEAANVDNYSKAGVRI